jgi:hypothetical protein
MTKMTNTKPHPLEDIVLRAFAEQGNHDASSLGYFLAGGYVRPGALSYNIVAKDALAYMESQGKLRCDISGWYYLVEEHVSIHLNK